MWWLLRFLIVGPSKEEPKKPTVAGLPMENNRLPIQLITFGNVRGRVWQNWNPAGETYYNIDLVRVTGKDRTSKSFRPEDLDDVNRVVVRTKAWLRDGTDSQVESVSKTGKDR